MAKSRLCSIPDCGKAHEAKGYCSAQYERLCRHGDPFGGGTSPGDPLRFIHESAVLHASDECLPWPFGKGPAGYAGMVLIDGKKVLASRYVCELVNGPPPTPEHEAAHSCGKGHEACIAPGHLVWKTHAENEADKLIHGTHGRGERNSKAKLTEAAVREILSLKGKETNPNLASRFGVVPQTISNIHTGRSWSWITEDSKEDAA